MPGESTCNAGGVHPAAAAVVVAFGPHNRRAAAECPLFITVASIGASRARPRNCFAAKARGRVRPSTTYCWVQMRARLAFQ
ncbi:hypothetical protein MRX96_034239 [Rhipicephalus microplus]